MMLQILVRSTPLVVKKCLKRHRGSDTWWSGCPREDWTPNPPVARAARALKAFNPTRGLEWTKSRFCR